jgi:UDP-2,4-diacetamido-2,4,6-trideoxy-beta-L-altropyranose hydrolase
VTGTDTVLFRTVAGPEIGFGHLRRCLTLAGALEAVGVRASFLVTPVLLERVAAAGFEAIAVGADGGVAETLEHAGKASARVVVTDSYDLTGDYHAAVMRAVRVVAIDDLAERALPVDLVVNGSAGAEHLAYRGAASTQYLVGPRYMLLRPEFGEWSGRATQERVHRVLVMTGGGDVHGLAPRLARWTIETLGDVDVDVVLGPMVAAAPPETLTAHGRQMFAWPARATLHRDPEDIRSLMRSADLAVCAGGQTLYELAATGTPAVAVQAAANQTKNLAALAAAGTVVVAGAASDPDLQTNVTTALTTLANAPDRRAMMTDRGRHAVDGQGAARVAHAIAALVERA